MVIVVSKNSDASTDAPSCSFGEKKIVVLSSFLSGASSEDDEDENSSTKIASTRLWFLEDENIRLKLTVLTLQRELDRLRHYESTKAERFDRNNDPLHPFSDHATPRSRSIDHLPTSPTNMPKSLGPTLFSSLGGSADGDENMPIEAPLPSSTRATATSGSAPSHDIESHQSAPGLHHRRGPGPPRSEYTPLNVMAKYDSTTSIDPDESEASLEGAGLDGLPAATATTINSLSFCARVQDRAGWLVGLLVLQSMSSFIISRNEALLQAHLVIVQFLTMLVGAGGNAGNQASVRVIRGLATGQVHDENINDFLLEELMMGLALSGILGLAGCIRALVFAVPWAETLAITTSLWCIVFISILLGALLPLGMKRLHIDPAHSSTTIQVLMDILGVTITVAVSGSILDSPFHTHDS